MADRDAGAAAINPLSPYQIKVNFGGPNGNAPGTGSGWFGPMAPMQPAAPKEVAGRTWDFAPGYNLAVTPRAYEPIGFGQLRMLARSYDLMRLVIETRKDQMCKLPWDIKLKEDPTKKPGGKKAAIPGDVQNRINALRTFFARPDGDTRFRSWFRSVLEDVFVIDAPTLYRQRTRGGQLCALVQIDGALIKPVVDDWGRTPKPFKWNGQPVVWNSRTIEATNYQAQGFQFTGGMLYPPAYQQVLKGIPAIDYTTRDILYRPYNSQPGSPYGYSPVEQAIITVNIALRRQLFTLSYFTEGNVPEALISVPENWTVNQIQDFQSYWDALLSGNLGQRRKAKFVPGGVGKNTVQIKDPELTGKTDEWLARVICFAFSVSPQPFMAMMNRATANTAKETAEEEGLEPVKAWWKEVADDVIEQEFASRDLEWSWVEEAEIDQVKQQTILSGYTDSGILTINMALERLGEEKSDDPAADLHMVKTATGYVPIDANTIEGKQANIDAFGLPPAPGGFGAPGADGATGDTAPGKAGPGGQSKPVAAGAKPAGKQPAGTKDAKGGDQKGKEVGKVADAPFAKRRRRLPPVTTQRPVVVRAQARMKAAVAAGLRKLGAAVAKQARRELGKVAKDQKDDQKRAREIAEAIDLAGLEALQDTLTEEGEAVAADAANRVLAQMGVEDRSDLVDQVNEAAALWARGNAAELVSFDDDADPMLAQTTRDMILNQIADGLEANVGMDEIADNIAESTAFSPERAELIARTEIRRANSQGSLLGAKSAASELGVVMKKVWLTADDDDVDEDICQPNQDQGAIGLDDDFESGDDAPPGHPRCLPGDCLITAKGIAAASERRYDGNLVILDTAGGKRLRCTPNHPILTPSGWIAAHLLNEGDDVVCMVGGQRTSIGNGYDQDVPARIEEVAKAFGRSKQVSAVPVPTAAEDFHGDGVGSEVAVIWTDRLLQRRRQTTINQHRGKLALIAADMKALAHHSLRAGALLMKSVLAAAGDFIGGGNLSLATIWGHALPLDSFGFALPADMHASFLQVHADGAALQPKRLGDGIFGHAALVKDDDLLGRDSEPGLAPLPLRRPSYAIALAPKGNGADTDAVLASEVLQGVHGPETKDQVIRISRVPFSGHVYNLETESSFYVAEGIVTHNCRCAISYEFDDSDAPDASDTEEE